MTDERSEAIPANGAAGATVLAVGLGSFVLGVGALAGDASPTVARLFNVWPRTGPLSGVTTLAIIVWLGTWFALARAWNGRNLDLRRINVLASALILAGLLLTFPPFMDLLQGK